MADECLDEVNERSTYIVTVSFIDEDGNDVVPDSATYRLDDKERRTNLVPTTTIAPLASRVDVEITSDQNYIIRSRSESEIRRLTVEFDYGIDRHGTAEYRYRLINLYGVVDVPSPSPSPSASASPSS